MDKKVAPKKTLSGEEKRRRRYLERVRQVRRMKRNILIGVTGLAMFLVIFFVVHSRKPKETFAEQPMREAELESEEDKVIKSVATDKRAEYLQIIEDLKDTDERYQKVLDRQEEYTEGVLRICAQNEETLDFVVDYPDKKDSAPDSTVGDVTKGQVPLLIQWDRRWGYAPYGDETIVAVSGCGPTCIAMVACGLTGRNDITPAKVAAYSANNGFLTATRDTSWDLMTYGGEEYGITGTMLGLDEIAMANQLAAGHPIIASVGPGDFTTAGHFIVLTGYDGVAFSVNDPNSLKRSQKTWTFEQLKDQIVNLWYYTQTGW